VTKKLNTPSIVYVKSERIKTKYHKHEIHPNLKDSEQSNKKSIKMARRSSTVEVPSVSKTIEQYVVQVGPN